MASSKAQVLSVVIFSVLAIGFQISGLLTPGWFIYKTDVNEVENLPTIFRRMFLFQTNDQPQALPHESDNPQQEQEVKYEASAHIGLWFARGCLHADTNPESSGDKKKGRCNCTTISIDDAMKLVNNDPEITSMDKQNRRADYIFFNELRIEAAIGSVFAIFGFVAALVAIKKDSRPVVFIASAMMLTSCILVFIPVLRLGMANYEIKRTLNMMDKLRDEEHADITFTGKLGFPYSLVLSGSGMIAAFIACLILSISSCIKSRRNAQGRWTRFYNEYAGEPGVKMDPSKEKIPEFTLHFGEVAEPLPEKVAEA